MPGRASAKRYAQATFELAVQQDRLDRWAGDLRLINEGLQNPELKTFLEHAKIPLPQKVQTIAEVFPEADPLVQNLLSLLVSRGLVDLALEVENEYEQLLNEFRGREQVEVLSAVALETSERNRIAGFLTALMNKEIVLDSQVDPSILGGLVIKVGDRLIDGSTRTKLEELGKELQRGRVGAEV
jgi:F-type H+-transporting ATPase subunit delta